MNKINKFLAVFGVFIIALVVGTYLTSRDESIHGGRTEHHRSRHSPNNDGRRPPKERIETNEAFRSRARVPAYLSAAPDKESLPRTLSPDAFTGRARAAYAAVREIPVTIAQLPCFCHCYLNFGHRSLHGCFEDEHAGRCAICIDEALTAYRLQKEEKLSPGQIREQLIAQYAK